MLFRSIAFRAAALVLFALQAPAFAEQTRPIIMLTGYWAPTNEMLRQFSTNPKQNHGHWSGSNWRNLGYDIYAYFPEFPPGTGSVGVGDFRVDFAAVKKDHAKYTALLKPVALIGFGLDAAGVPWKIEVNYRDYWAGTGVWHSTLPEDAIREAVSQDLGPGFAYVNRSGDPGNYLCGYMAMLNAQYAYRHSDDQDKARVRAAGFIHVNTDLRSAIQATEDTLGALIRSIRSLE